MEFLWVISILWVVLWIAFLWIAFMGARFVGSFMDSASHFNPISSQLVRSIE